MRKFLTIFLIFSFVVSVFDVMDVDDIKLGDKEIFTTQNEHADNEYDDINDDGFKYSTVSVFILSTFDCSIKFVPVSTKAPKVNKNKVVAYNFTCNNLYRPPII